MPPPESVRRLTLEETAERIRPPVLADERTLPVVEPLQALLPTGLVRGTTVAVGERSLALALAAGPAASGTWVAALGLGDLGLVAAAEHGLALDRFVVVADPGDRDRWVAATATLVDAFGLVLLGSPPRLAAGVVRRLTARARDRGAVLVVVADDRRSWPAPPDVHLQVTDPRWDGLGQGHGHLRGRRVVGTATGRGRAAQPRRQDLWLPAPGGGMAVGEPTGRRHGEAAPTDPPAVRVPA